MRQTGFLPGVITAALGMAVTIREINRLLKYMGGNYHEINYGTADKTDLKIKSQWTG